MALPGQPGVQTACFLQDLQGSCPLSWPVYASSLGGPPPALGSQALAPPPHSGQWDPLESPTESRHRKGTGEARGRVPVEAQALSCSCWSLSFPFPRPPSWEAQKFHHGRAAVLIREGPPEPLPWALAGW